MWPLCPANNVLWILVPLLIGLLTGWWMWAGRERAAPSSYRARAVPPVAGLTAIGIPAAVGASDELLQIKGVGPKLKALLNGLGVRRFDQIAAWGPDEVNKVDAHLETFRGRIQRDHWIEQAALLARGKFAEFEAKFGGLDSGNDAGPTQRA